MLVLVIINHTVVLYGLQTLWICVPSWLQSSQNCWETTNHTNLWLLSVSKLHVSSVIHSNHTHLHLLVLISFLSNFSSYLNHKTGSYSRSVSGLSRHHKLQSWIILYKPKNYLFLSQNLPVPQILFTVDSLLSWGLTPWTLDCYHSFWAICTFFSIFLFLLSAVDYVDVWC